MAQYHIAVIDVGKTNKKLIIFDDRLKVVKSVYETFDEYVEDGVHYEDIENAWAWYMEQLTKFSAKYSIKAISVSTHGATSMSIDSNGSLAIPPISYTTDAGEEFDSEFFGEFGSQQQLQKETFTAKVGNMINIAKVLYYCKKTWPDKFERIDKVLNFPQYFGYLLTGKTGAEPTYTGCHTYLYNHAEKKYSSVAEKLGIRSKLPEKISNPWDILGTITPAIAEKTGLGKDCVVTMGIHDSNSSLLPYLVKGYDNFVLNSTGTWCVAMHPTDTLFFNKEELGKLVFFNLSAFGDPVKTSIFMGGLEFDTYTSILKEINGDREYPSFSPELYAKIISEKNLFILPSVVKNTGIFPHALPRVVENGQVFELDEIRSKSRVPSFFGDFETAYAVLNISLALQTKAALDMTGFTGGGTLFTEGGFRKNDPYNALLASLYPDTRAVLTNFSEATAFGAALLGKAALEATTPGETKSFFEIETVDVERAQADGIEQYRDSFTKLISERQPEA